MNTLFIVAFVVAGGAPVSTAVSTTTFQDAQACTAAAAVFQAEIPQNSLFSYLAWCVPNQTVPVVTSPFAPGRG